MAKAAIRWRGRWVFIKFKVVLLVVEASMASRILFMEERVVTVKVDLDNNKGANMISKDNFIKVIQVFSCPIHLLLWVNSKLKVRIWLPIVVSILLRTLHTTISLLQTSVVKIGVGRRVRVL
jgi:hypothetical protein